LAHEAVHAHQQANASVPPTDQLVVSSPSSPEEIEAGRFADALESGASVATPAQMPTGNVARVMRLRFEATPKDPVPLDIETRINKSTGGPPPGGFAFGWGEQPHLFTWESDVKVHGEPEEDFSDWEVGMLQIVRDYWMNIWWGYEPTPHCHGIFANRRDSKCQSISWFDHTATSAPFTADGDVRKAKIEDSPGALSIPYKNPEPGRDETFGKFNFGSSFVTYLSAHKRSAGFVPEAFQPLKSVYWNLSLEGNFDAGSSNFEKRVIKTGGGKTNVGGVIESYPKEYPPIVGGTTALEETSKISQCWNPMRPLDPC
jgi:hypothetical protein